MVQLQLALRQRTGGRSGALRGRQLRQWAERNRYTRGRVRSDSGSAIRGRALLRERFWDLAGAYGRLVADGHTTTLQVSAGGFTKKVELLFLDAYEGEKARESSRPLRVLMIIRGWFNDPGAVDLRKYDQMVIDAAR